MSKDTNQIPVELGTKISQSREVLKNSKPLVYKKLMNYLENEKCGKKNLYLLDFVYDFSCNFHCSHCCAAAFSKMKSDKMTIEDVKKVADMADEMGVLVFSLIGGEPLAWKELDDIVKAIDPQRFLINITTNGYLLDEKKARHLKEIGISKINVSIDSFIRDEHDMFRNKQGSYDRAMDAVKIAVETGFNTQISTVVTHQNIHSDGFNGMLEYSKQHNIGLDLKVATPTGMWLGNTEALVTEEDARYINQLRNQHPLLRRDLFAMPGSKGGCPAVTNILYVLPNGEVLPCIFIHISLGNIFKESLEEIRSRGLTIKEFNEYSPVCLAGEQCSFFDKYIRNTFNKIEFPLNFDEGFYTSSNN